MPHQDPTLDHDPTHGQPAAEQGQAMSEYALMLSGVAMLAITAVFALGPKIAEVFGSTTNWIVKIAG